jgi:hypothetical protein
MASDADPREHENAISGLPNISRMLLWFRKVIACTASPDINARCPFLRDSSIPLQNGSEHRSIAADAEKDACTLMNIRKDTIAELNIFQYLKQKKNGYLETF